MSKQTTTNRRQFIKLGSLAGAASLLPGTRAVASPQMVAPGKAKNVIFLVVDGMCNGTLGLAHHWKLRQEGAQPHWMQLFERPDLYRSLQDTASASSPVTDSAAAASAWGSGKRVMNGALNVAPDGKALKPILSYAKDAGKKTALVSTSRITHATPAGFAVSVPQRDMEDEIARQYLAHEVDLLLGGGVRHFIQEQKDGSVVDLLPRFKEKGYHIARNRRELKKAKKSQRLLGLFADSHVPYAIDRKNDPALADVPHLPEMFQAALNHLKDSPNGFFLQVESARVDHAGHANDAGAILHEYLEFDRCIPLALDYIKQHPDTLLIVTTDHGTGGCQLDGQGERYAGSGPALDRIDQMTQSYEWLQKTFTQSGRFDPATFTRATGIRPQRHQSAQMQQALDRGAKYLSGAINQAFGEELNQITSVGWSSSKHTAECVDLLAFGPGAQAIPPFINNNELFGYMLTAMGLEHSES
ncbi:MAG: alkaline phosphatase [Opitutales bacterium]